VTLRTGSPIDVGAMDASSFGSMGNNHLVQNNFGAAIGGLKLPAGVTATGNLLTARLGMCPASVIGNAIRVSVDTDPNLFQAVRLGSVTGFYTTTRDITNMALFWNTFTSANRRKQAITRGTPDDCVSNGVYTPTPAFATAATNWKTVLVSNQFCIRLIDLGNAIQDVQSIDGTGLLTTYADYGWVAADRLKFFRARTTDNKPIKKSYKIATRLTGTTYQLVNWPAGKTAFNVRARKLAYIPVPVSDIGAVLATSRKTGRPFGLRAGRRRVVTI
jgi:hypothetical protein